MFSDVIILETKTQEINDLGDVCPKFEKTEVFGNKKSVSQTEFYQAQAVGLKPTIKVEIYIFDYDDQEYFTYENKRYKVLRTYEKNSEIIELIGESDIYADSKISN